LLLRRETGLEVIRRVAEIIDIIDREISCAQHMPESARVRSFTRALDESRRRNRQVRHFDYCPTAFEVRNC
jgi:hypothetical protein